MSQVQNQIKALQNQIKQLNEKISEIKNTKTLVDRGKLAALATNFFIYPRNPWCGFKKYRKSIFY